MLLEEGSKELQWVLVRNYVNREWGLIFNVLRAKVVPPDKPAAPVDGPNPGAEAHRQHKLELKGY